MNLKVAIKITEIAELLSVNEDEQVVIFEGIYLNTIKLMNDKKDTTDNEIQDSDIQNIMDHAIEKLEEGEEL